MAEEAAEGIALSAIAEREPRSSVVKRGRDNQSGATFMDAAGANLGAMIVTGGSRGIGAATARLAAARGYSVCVNYLSRRDAAEAVVAEITNAGGRATAIAGDVAKEAEVVRLFDE